MMLQIQKKQKYNLLFLKRIILIKSLVAIFAIGLFAFDTEDLSIYISNDKNENLLLKPVSNLNNEQYDKIFEIILDNQSIKEIKKF